MPVDGFCPSATARTAVSLLHAACELAGGEERLARRLRMSVLLLRSYMEGGRELPQSVLLRTVDLPLEERELQSPLDEEAPRWGGDGEHDCDRPA